MVKQYQYGNVAIHHWELFLGASDLPCEGAVELNQYNRAIFISPSLSIGYVTMRLTRISKPHAPKLHCEDAVTRMLWIQE